MTEGLSRPLAADAHGARASGQQAAESDAIVCPLLGPDYRDVTPYGAGWTNRTDPTARLRPRTLQQLSQDATKFDDGRKCVCRRSEDVRSFEKRLLATWSAAVEARDHVV